MFQFGKDFVVYFRKTYFTKNKSKMKNNDKTEEKDIEVKDGNVEAAAAEEAKEAETTDCNEETTEDGNDVNAKLEAAKKEIEQLRDCYLRTAAEFDNYKKRTLKEKAELLLNGSEKTVCAVLPVLDDFERALATETDDAQAVKDGMKLIYNKFKKVLESIGVKKIETDGQDFNVDYHEAVAMVPGMGDDNKGKVIDCLQTGYKLNDKVIRHAKVAVGQ